MFWAKEQGAQSFQTRKDFSPHEHQSSAESKSGGKLALVELLSDSVNARCMILAQDDKKLYNLYIRRIWDKFTYVKQVIY